jgi:predicted nucleic acid-binding protein
VTFVIDTNVLVDHLRSSEPATETFRAALRSGRRVAGSVVTRVELWRGARAAEAAVIEAVESVVDWVPVDHAIASVAVRHAERFGRSHAGIDVPAYVIAATAERLDAQLLTRNVRHFPMFPDLEPPY